LGETQLSSVDDAGIVHWEKSIICFLTNNDLISSGLAVNLELDNRPDWFLRKSLDSNQAGRNAKFYENAFFADGFSKNQEKVKLRVFIGK